MARMVFSVSLSPQDVAILDDIASRQTRGNRSALISSLLRQSVLNQYKVGELKHVAPEESRNYQNTGKCNPMHVDGKCLICWGE